jgi:hypothetical protein
MLIHIFSNGGSCMLYHLYDLYAEAAVKLVESMEREGENSLHRKRLRTLPEHVTIFDSVPGRWSYSGSTQGVLAGIPAGFARTLAFPLIHLLGLWWIIKYMLLKIPEETHVWGLAHNDLTRTRETCRSHIYSEVDGFVNHRDVDEHADHAESKGYVVVCREKFTDSQHVAHGRTYPDRYWNVVRGNLGSKTPTQRL